MSNPRTTINILGAQVPKNPDDRSILVVGQKLGGTATSGALVENIISKDQALGLFGASSMVYKGLAAIIDKCANSLNQPKISAISLTDQGASVAASATLTFTGTATKAGKITLYIDSMQRKYELDVAVGALANDIATSIAAKINADNFRVVSAVATTNVVTIEARNTGTQGNSIGTKFDLGLSEGITLVTTAMANGATDPVLTGLFDPIADKRFTSIVYPGNYDIPTLSNEITSRFNVDDKIIDGVGIVGLTDTYANLVADTSLQTIKGIAKRSNKLVNRDTHKGGAVFESPFVLAARAAAVREIRLTVGSNTSSLSTSGQAVGGSFFGAIPYADTPEQGLRVIESGDDFTSLEASQLKEAGHWLLSNNSNDTALIYDEAITTYKTDSLGLPDITFKYLNYIDSYTIARDYIFKNIKSDFSQRILTTGQLVAGRPMTNAKQFIGVNMGYYATLSGFSGDNSYVLLNSSPEAKDRFRQELEQSIVVNLPQGKITADVLALINTQVREILISIIPTFE